MYSSPSTTTADVTKCNIKLPWFAPLCEISSVFKKWKKELDRTACWNMCKRGLWWRSAMPILLRLSPQNDTTRKHTDLNCHEQCLKGCWSSWFGTYHLWTGGVDSQHRWNHVSITKEVVMFSKLFLSIFNTDMKNKLHPTTAIFLKKKDPC